MTEDKNLNALPITLEDIKPRLHGSDLDRAYRNLLKEPKHFTPNPDEWRRIPEFSNYEMNYLGHLRYVGSGNTIPWADLDGSKWYELQTRNRDKNSSQEFLVHIFPMITLVRKTFPEIWER